MLYCTCSVSQYPPPPTVFHHYFCNYLLVDKFCYLGDMLSVDGDADVAVEARILLARISNWLE